MFKLLFLFISLNSSDSMKTDNFQLCEFKHEMIKEKNCTSLPLENVFIFSETSITQITPNRTSFYKIDSVSYNNNELIYFIKFENQKYIFFREKNKCVLKMYYIADKSVQCATYFSNDIDLDTIKFNDINK